jgi:hypothetical protein
MLEREKGERRSANAAPFALYLIIISLEMTAGCTGRAATGSGDGPQIARRRMGRTSAAELRRRDQIAARRNRLASTQSESVGDGAAVVGMRHRHAAEGGVGAAIGDTGRFLHRDGGGERRDRGSIAEFDVLLAEVGAVAGHRAGRRHAIPPTRWGRGWWRSGCGCPGGNPGRRRRGS